MIQTDRIIDQFAYEPVFKFHFGYEWRASYPFFVGLHRRILRIRLLRPPQSGNSSLILASKSELEDKLCEIYFRTFPDGGQVAR